MDTNLAIAQVIAACLTGLVSSLHCLGMCGGGIAAMMLTAKPRQAIRTSQIAQAADQATLQAIDQTTHQSMDTSLHADLSVASVNAASSVKQWSYFPLSSLSTSPSSAGIMQARLGMLQHLPLILAFNFGRIASYSIAGGLAGGIAALISQRVSSEWLLQDAMPIRLFLFVIANVMMLLTGLYIAGWTRGLAPLERVGQHLWRHIAPLTKHLMPIQSAKQAVVLGGLWGWIPCGLVYAMLMIALASGNAANGAMTMFAFGLGTLPAMTFAGLLSVKMKSLLRDSRLRLIAGLVLMVIALMGLNRAPLLVKLGSATLVSTLSEVCHSVISGSGFSPVSSSSSSSSPSPSSTLVTP